MTDQRHTDLIVVMRAIEAEMQRIDLWGTDAPSEQALQSQEPFCIDTMSFADWVQWVLIPRMRHLLIQGLPLPSNCAIHPMAEESWKDQPQTAALLELIKRFDDLLNQPH